MKKEIQYTSADDENGNTVLIDDAEKGRDYFCPVCKGKFILRKSGKTGKGTGKRLVDDITFEGIGGPHRQGDTFIGIRIKAAAKGRLGFLLFPHMIPSLDEIWTIVIKANIKKIIRPGGV